VAAGGAAPRDPLVARVGTDGITVGELDGYLVQVRGTYGPRGLRFPEPGTPQYANVEAAAIDYLVTRSRDEQAAAEVGATVSDDAVDRELAGLQSEPDFERVLRENGLTVANVRTDIRSELLLSATFTKVVSGIRGASPDELAKAREHAMARWERERDTRYAPAYEPGFDPAKLRNSAPPQPPPPQPQRSDCQLAPGEYGYAELVRLGCAGDFEVPGVDGPPCADDLLGPDPFWGGFSAEDTASGYEEYATDTATVDPCVSDPRGTTVSIGPVEP
jgi:hypothetical protein